MVLTENTVLLLDKWATVVVAEHTIPTPPENRAQVVAEEAEPVVALNWADKAHLAKATPVEHIMATDQVLYQLLVVAVAALVVLVEME